MRVLVTGASGFVGSALVSRLVRDPQYSVRASSRTRPAGLPSAVEWSAGPAVGPDADWGSRLAGIDVVVHLAAHVHVMSAGGPEVARLFHQINVEGTRRLAEHARVAGVKRLVFLSSVKVHGEDGCFTEDSAFAPVDPYGLSKRDAEQALRLVAQRGGLEVVVLRPPLVYGPGVKANFRSLMDAVRRGRLLPLGSVTNRRSLLGVDNLVDAIMVCMRHPAAADEAFLVSDDDDVSTPELIRRLGRAAGIEARLMPMPVWCLRAGAAVLGQTAAIDRLTGSLQIDMAKARRLLSWVPPVGLDEGLRRAMRVP